MQNFKKLWYLLNSYERKLAVLLLFMIFIMAILDMTGVASILPFMSVIANPEIIKTNLYLSEVFMFSKKFGVKNESDFTYILGIFVLLTLTISIIFKAITTYAMVRFVHMREYSIGKRLVEGYLNQPFSWFLNRHSSELGKSILSETGILVGNAIKPLVELIARLFVVVALVTLIIIVDPAIALIFGSFLSLIYGLIFFFSRNHISKIGKERLKNNESRFKIINDAFSATKEIKLGGLEQIYTRLFSVPARNFARNKSSAVIIGQLPRFVLELIVFGGILLIMLYLIKHTGNFNDALPIISLYVVAGYRLMPAIQQIYLSFTMLAFQGASIDKMYKELKELKPLDLNQNQSIW